ncbi:hypothetical protein BE21_56530 [Sorangium cellulosum]|uniref:Uncharacterized protein n=1 Tax=Sorangium cellulosum TaxID=56 RepID=A0A150T9T1_SORCE|nr:hypothetical protein BE21_56530 [Sorangium cellulosum]
MGFDVSELPWSPSTFIRERELILQVIEAAKAGWDRLGYGCGSDATVWSFGGRPKQLALCPVHRVYQHEYGCAVCSDR